MDSNEQLIKAIKNLTEEISEMRSTIANHFNPEYFPNVANEMKQLNKQLPDLIKALENRDL